MEKVVKKLFFAWGMDKEKKFLEEMAEEGWILKKVGFGKYTFYKDKPKDLIYEFDFNILDKKKEEEYLSYFEDWTLVDRYGSWYYFYTERKDDIDISIFNDNDSKKKMLRRLLMFLVLVGFPLYYNQLLLIPNLDESERIFPKFYFFFIIVNLVFMLLHLFALIKIFIVMNKLNKSIRQ